jgi:flagellar protein FlbD
VITLLSRGHFNYQPGGLAVIVVTRLNGQQFVVNADKIRYVESTPDTLICCDTGEKVMVKETLAEVIRRAIEYARVIRRPISD